MSARARPTVVGLFVAGALVLAVAAVLFFGGGKLFSHKEKFIVYFSDSVNGLSVGSPVKFKGVQIGEVTKIMIHYDQPQDSDAIPVMLEIDTTRLHKDLGDPTDLSDPEVFKGQVYDAGLRARLQMLSFVTNQLYIELDDETGAAAPKFVSLSHEYKEIPSVSSGLSEMVKSVTLALANLSKVDFAEMSQKINHLADELTQGVDDLNFKEINTSLVTAANNLNAILSDPKVKESLLKLGTTLDDLDSLAANLNQQVQPLSDEIKSTASSARNTLDQLDKTLEAVRDVVAPDSPLRANLDKMIIEITHAAQSVRVLSNFLEANPGALLTGKVPTDGLTTTSSPLPKPADGNESAPPERAGGK